VIQRSALIFLALGVASYAAPAVACLPNEYLPFVATANVRQADNSWRTIQISSYGARDDEEGLSLAWTLRVQSRSSQQAALMNLIDGRSQLFPLTRNAGARLRNTSVEEAARYFNLPLNILETGDALYRSEYGPTQDVRSFAGRPCAFREQSDGAWACFDRTGIALAAGPRVGQLSYRVVSIAETRLRRAEFTAPNYPEGPSTGAGGSPRLAC
jgi:hypothetical protein